jgi:DNA-binding response OmpR family regulator
MMRLFLYNYLENYFVVDCFEIVSTALSKLDADSLPDIIVNNFCEENANDVQSLRNNMLLRQTPLLMLTNDDKSNQRIEAFKMQAADCISKPFNPTELIFRINSLVDFKNSMATVMSSMAG